MIMKGNLSYKTPDIDLTLDDIEDQVKNRVRGGVSNITVTLARVTYDYKKEETRVYAEYEKTPKKIKVNIGELALSNNLLMAIQEDQDEGQPLNETIINALENYYKV